MADVSSIKQQIEQLIRDRQWERIRPLFAQLHPADIAEIINAAPPSAHNSLFDLVDDDIKPDVLADLSDKAEADILEELTDEELSDIVEEMAPDDAADLLADLEEKRSEEILDLMEEEESDEVRELLRYDEDTAGGIMTPDFVAVRGNLTARQALDYLGSLELDEPVYNLYVVDDEGRLTGWIQLWELLKKANRNRLLDHLAHKDPIAVRTDTDQEEVARLATKYDLSSLPVLDEEGRLVGRITIDDIMDVIEEEATEDIFKLAGSSEIELEDPSPLRACRVRLPWLFITLGTGFITSLILKHFIAQLTLSEILALSFFVPIVMAMGGNTGIQSSTLVIRRIALGTGQFRDLFKVVSHEIITGAIMGIICGLVIGIWARFVIGRNAPPPAISPAYLALTVGVALFCAMTFAAVFGAIVPVLLDRMKIDPAVASGPFVTASNDIFALLIYFGVTLLMLGVIHALT